MRLRFAAGALLLLQLGGCAAILDLPDAPELIEDGPWQCLNEPISVTPPSALKARVRVHACDFISNCTIAVTGLTGRLCSKRDVGCTNPLASGIMDMGGDLMFDVPTSGTGFDGYLEITAPSALCTDPVFGAAGPMLCELLPGCDPAAPNEQCRFPTYVRSLLFFNPPIVADLPAPLTLPLLSSGGLPSVIEAAGAGLDPTTGNLFLTAIGCDGRPASGVTYTIAQHQDKVTQLYVDHGVVSDTRLETDASGIGGFIGVPAGFAEVVAYNGDLERIGEIGVQAAPFTMTYSAVVPTPPR